MRSVRALCCVALAVVAFGAASCRTSQEADVSAASAAVLSGSVAIDGSNTVLPISQLVVDEFSRQNTGVHVSLAGTGTVAGFEHFCNGELDIADASRPIEQKEIDACAAKGIHFIELPIGFDAVTIVVNAKNSFVDCLTTADLKKLWEPNAGGTVKSWNQVRSTFPSTPLALFGPGSESGTYDYFTLAIVGESGKSRADYTHNPDDNVLAAGVAADPAALGYFGFAYYVAHQDTLKAVAVDAGKGCVLPNVDTVRDHSYQPLSRPLFIYVKAEATGRPEVRALVRAFTDPATTQVVKKVGYMPLPLGTTLRVGQRFEDGTTGSLFGGKGAVVGVTAESLRDDDKIRSALVR